MWAGRMGWRALEGRSLAAVKTAIVSSLIEGAADGTVLWWSGPQVPQLLGLEHFVSSLTLLIQL